jgi:hypothetical protein
VGDAAPFVCPFCGATSHNIGDALNRYCARCHVFVDDEEATYLAIIELRLRPNMTFYKAGADAHAAGKKFHEGPKPFFTASAISWRMGWNDRALMRLAEDPPADE